MFKQILASINGWQEIISFGYYTSLAFVVICGSSILLSKKIEFMKKANALFMYFWILFFIFFTMHMELILKK